MGDVEGRKDAAKGQAFNGEYLHAAIAGIGDVDVVAARDGQAMRRGELARCAAWTTDAGKCDELGEATVESFDNTGEAIQDVNAVFGVQGYSQSHLKAAEISRSINERPNRAGQWLERNRLSAVGESNTVRPRGAPARE